MIEKKVCIKCQNYAKTKLFNKLRIVFNNWCDLYQRPLGLCKSCQFQEPEQQPEQQEYEEIIEYEFVYY